MRTFEKSTKLDNVCYDVRGPVVEEADRMIADGVHTVSYTHLDVYKRQPSSAMREKSHKKV